MGRRVSVLVDMVLFDLWFCCSCGVWKLQPACVCLIRGASATGCLFYTWCLVCCEGWRFSTVLDKMAMLGVTRRKLQTPGTAKEQKRKVARTINHIRCRTRTCHDHFARSLCRVHVLHGESNRGQASPRTTHVPTTHVPTRIRMPHVQLWLSGWQCQDLTSKLDVHATHSLFSHVRTV